MTTVYKSSVWSKGNPVAVEEKKSAVKMLWNTIDCRNTFLVDSTGLPNATAGVGAGDSTKAIVIPAGAYVLGVKLQVVTAAGATCTVGLGDSGSATQLATAANCNTTTDTFLVAGAKYYSAADYLLVTFNHATSTAVFKVGIAYIDTAAN